MERGELEQDITCVCGLHLEDTAKSLAFVDMTGHCLCVIVSFSAEPSLIYIVHFLSVPSSLFFMRNPSQYRGVTHVVILCNEL